MRQHEFSDANCHLRRSKYGAIDVSDPKRLKLLESENGLLKNLLPQSMLANGATREALGKPKQIANVASCNGRLCYECLNEHWFTSLAHAKAVIEPWRREYKE